MKKFWIALGLFILVIPLAFAADGSGTNSVSPTSATVFFKGKAPAETYTQDGFECRDFLASYLRGQSQAWLQGAACRTSQGKWEVKSLKPLKRS